MSDLDRDAIEWRANAAVECHRRNPGIEWSINDRWTLRTIEAHYPTDVPVLLAALGRAEAKLAAVQTYIDDEIVPEGWEVGARNIRRIISGSEREGESK